MTAPATATGLRLEYQHAAFVPVSRPRISWHTETEERDWAQTAAELELLLGGKRYRTGVAGDESVLVEWPFRALQPFDEAELRVRVTGPDGASSAWSEPVAVRAGFLPDGAWKARFIERAGTAARAEPFLARREFQVRDGLTSAILFATAQGAYQAEVNGHSVDDQVLKPGWTPYDSRLIHETTDVTSLVRPGANALGASVAGGWFTEIYGFREGAAPVYGEQPAFAAQLVLRYENGSTETIVTDSSWATARGPIRSSGLYVGERYDVRERIPGWSSAGFSAGGWTPAATREVEVTPEPRTSPAVRIIDRVPVAAVITSPSGKTLLDFGQNLVGRLEISVHGSEGDTITLRHAEVLEDGELGTRPLRRASSVDTLTLGSEPEVWQPEFTYHGFRYAEVSGWPGDVDPTAVTALVIHSDMTRTGWFSSSHELLDRFHESVVWGMRGNFFYLPTDCPQRDERLGWLGDIQVFTPTASYLYESNGFLAAWMRDVALEQQALGGVPFIVPNVLDSARIPAAAWGDAATIVPWTLYERFGDVGVLNAQFESMRAWVDQVLALAGPRRLWEDGFQFGDWLDPTAPAEKPADGRTDPDLVASAYLYRSTRILADAAAIIGKAALAAEYSAIAEEVRSAWVAEYSTSAGRLMSDSQTAYALAIQFDLVDDARKEIAGRRLADLVRANGYRIGTGFVGTPLIQDALTSTGHLAAAARLITQTELPSWLYPVTMGATTMWERWDSILEDGSVNPGEMTSFNHYALGAVADWLHRVLGGLSPATPGYRRIRIQPTPLEGFDHASSTHDTPYGVASSAWRAEDGKVLVTAVVPPNTRAEVHLPDGTTHEVGSGEHSWTVADPRIDEGDAIEFSLSTPLSTIIDDADAFAAVTTALASVDPAIARQFLANTRWISGQSLDSSTIDTPAFLLKAFTDALTEVNARRRG